MADEKSMNETGNAPSTEKKPDEGAKGGSIMQKSPMVVTCITGVAALAIGIAIGHFAIGGGSMGAIGTTTLQENQLDTPVATYTYNGKTNNVTAREVITAQSSLDSAKQDDGSYKVPASDSILVTARNAIVEQDAEAKNINVSDDDISSYAKTTFGTDDFDSLAQNYGVDSDTVKTLLKQSVMMSKLRDSVMGDDNQTAKAPEAPKTPDDGNTSTANADYAKYIINLAGDEWDADKGAWKSEDGPYAKALASYDIKNDSASYEAAQAAYYVAYDNYSQQANGQNSKWTDYVNGLLCKASIQLSTIGA